MKRLGYDNLVFFRYIVVFLSLYIYGKWVGIKRSGQIVVKIPAALGKSIF